MLRVLLTNDDGVQAPGLRALAVRLAQRASVTVIAPDGPRSACSHTITLHKPLRLTEHPRLARDFPNMRAYSCSGSPADCITLGLQHVCRNAPPHVVLSGINDGTNLGEDLIYSGTVAGAIEGAIQGVPSLAISLQGDKQTSYRSAAELVELLLSCLLYGHYCSWQQGLAQTLSRDDNTGGDRWKLAVAAAQEETDVLPEPAAWLPPGLVRTPCFNVNIPDVAMPELRGIRWTALGHRQYEDVVVASQDPRDKPFYWIWGKRIIPRQGEDSDIHAIHNGYVAVTPLQGDLLNRTDLDAYRQLFGATSATAGES